MHKTISISMTLGEVLEASPKADTVLSRFGIAHDARAPLWETLDEASTKLSRDRQAELLKELNAREDAPPLAITEKAARKAAEMLKKEGKSDFALRVKVVPGGCSGFSYRFEFDKPKEDDTVLKAHGLTVLVDPASAGLVQGSTLDYSESLSGAGFKVNNPNAKSGCGCGESFSV